MVLMQYSPYVNNNDFLSEGSGKLPLAVHFHVSIPKSLFWDQKKALLFWNYTDEINTSFWEAISF